MQLMIDLKGYFYGPTSKAPFLALIMLIAGLGASSWAAAQDDEIQLEEVAQKLNQVPVFYLVREGGDPHTVSANNSGNAIAPVFFYRQSAESLQTDLSEQGSDLTIKETALGKVYLQLTEQKSNQPRFALIGDPGQVMQARILNEDDSFNAVPLFSVRQESTGSHLTMNDSQGNQVLPLFVESQRVKAALAIVQEQNSDMAEDLEIVAIPLETVVSDMVNGGLPFEKVQFIPPQ